VSVKLHARLAPSSSEIWLTCLGAPAEWAKHPPRVVGFAAHEGTLAHTLCEAALSINAVPWKEGQTFTVEGDDIVVDQEMLNCVSLFTATVSRISDFCDWRIIEKAVGVNWLWDGSEPPENVFGTLDFGACDGLTLYVVDFKYGRGKAVVVLNNTQLLIYALGMYGRLLRERPDLAGTIENVCLTIIQPRAGGDPVRTWSIPVSELLYWGYAVLKPAIEAIADAHEGDLPLTPGNHCFWCPASRDCPAYKRMRTQRSIDSFPDYDPTVEDLDFAEEMI